MSEILFTMDVEDPDQDRDGSFVPPLLSVLEWLEEENRTGTFFVVGELAEKFPEAVRRIAKGGHEVALHGWQHIELSRLGENRFVRQTERGKSLLEDITGQQVVGYRAPMFSLTSETPWAESRLKELNFEYSSSVLPTNNPRFSFPGLPKKIFSWPSGLMEIPAPVSSVLSVETPFLGGIYFRYYPNLLLNRMTRGLSNEQVPWFYCHPYDFYWDKSYIRMRDTPLWVNMLLMGRRRNALNKMQSFFKGYKTTRTMQEFVRDQHSATSAPSSHMA